VPRPDGARRARAAVLLLIALTAVAPAHAAFLTLTDEQQAQALRLGQRTITTESYDGEWRVANGTGDSVMVITPFHRLVVAGRHAAFKNEPVKPPDQERMVTELKDRLVFWVYVHGAREEFARYYTPRLLVGDREIEPALVQNERTAQRQPNGVYLARCIYAFPNRDVTGKSQLVLVVRDAEEQIVGRFVIDLGKMR
jgi:hypothetical protein